MSMIGPRTLQRIVVGVVIAGCVSLPFAPAAHADDNGFVLNQATTGGPGIAGSGGNYEQTFRGVEIRGVPDAQGGKYTLSASDTDIPIAWEWYPGSMVTGTGAFSMSGAYDPATNQATGTFTYQNRATGTIKGSGYADRALDFSNVWTGDVTGTITGAVAEFYFSGTDASVCSLGGEDCSHTGSHGSRVWFVVTGTASPTPTEGPTDEWTMPPWDPSVERIGFTSEVSGDVYISPASEQDLEPHDRHWQRLAPGQQVPLGLGSMLRTGANGEVLIRFGTGAWTRLKSSTLFGIKWKTSETTIGTMLGRMLEGIAQFYINKAKDDTKQFEVETDRAIVGIKGTTFEVAVTAEATVVTVIEGVVELTDKATGAIMDVGPAERATVDAAGMTKVAAPDASLPPAPGPEAGASSPEAGASSLVLGVLVVIALAFVALIVLALMSLALQMRRRAR